MKKKKKRISLTALFLVLVFAVTGAGAVLAFSMYGDMFNYEPQGDYETDEKKPGAERVNVLLVGVDAAGTLTDVIMMMSLDSKEKNIKIASIPRDTLVKIKKKNQKINAANALGGMNLLIEKVKEITGAPIHHYVIVDTKNFPAVIDILGGVEFDVPQRMKYKDPVQGLTIDLQKGPQLLDGDKSEQLVRFRRYLNGDVDRVKVQQDFMKALFDQHFSSAIIPKIPELFSEMTKHVKTDITPATVVSNLKFASILFDKSDDVLVENFTIPGGSKYIDNLSYYVHDKEETLELFKEKFGGTGEAYIKEEKK